jgi:hypothetical protein
MAMPVSVKVYKISRVELAVKGAFSLDFTTTQLPAASAGATFFARNIKGAFQGIMIATTPNGCLRLMFRKPGEFKLVWPCGYAASAK